MLNLAYSMDSDSPLESAILNRKNYSEKYTKTVINMSKDVEADSDYYNLKNGTAEELIDFVNENENIDESFEYSRYWHGYLIILKPLLLIMNYNQIRYLFFTLTILCSIILSILIYKKFNMWYMLSFIFSILITDLLISAVCINTSICFLISLITSIYIIYRTDKIKNIYILFFFIGIITNVFDLLTNPILTLGLPLISYYMISEKKEKNLKQLILLMFNWAIGYFIFWFMKWLITDIIFNRNIIENAFLQILYRTTGESIGINALVYRLKIFAGNYIFILMYILLIMYIILLYINRKSIVNCLVYLLISLIPLIWFYVLKNHSTVHAFFSYRNLFIVIYGLCVGIFMQINLVCEREEK